MNVFLDANVLFTAAYNPEGLCRALFRLAAAGRCRILVSAFVVDEVRRNLGLKAPDKAAVLEPLLKDVSCVPEPAPSRAQQVRSAPLDEKDAPVLAAAISSGSDLFVTGDRRQFSHFFGQEVFGVRVVTPAQTFDLLVPV